MERAADAILSVINELRNSKEPESGALFAKLIFKSSCRMAPVIRKPSAAERD
jgi:hypothetical protein